MWEWLPPPGPGFTTEQVFWRLLAATGCGLLLGLDRELKGIAAGLRTHAMVALSSAVITLTSLMIYHEVRGFGQSDPDPLRVVQGLAQAIGFIGAGAIFISGGNVRNLTTAVNLWLSAGVGIASAAGQWGLVLIATVLGVVVVTALRLLERLLPGPADADDG